MRLPVCVCWVLLPALLVGCASNPEEEAEISTVVTVETGTVLRTTVRSFVHGFGTAQPRPSSPDQSSGGALLAASMSSRVREIAVSEGQVVEAGDLIVRLDDRMAQAALDAAQARLDLATKALDRTRLLFGQQNASQRQVQEAEQDLSVAKADVEEARGNLDLVQLHSPVDGIVSEIRVLPGQAVDPNTVVAQIINPDRLVLTIHVPADDASRVLQGQPALISSTSNQSAETDATVSFVSPSVEPESGTVMVRLIPSRAARLQPGGFYKARIEVERHEDVLAVPRESVFIDANGSGALSIVRDDLATKVQVDTGLEENGLIEVSGGGLEAGMQVVTTGAFALPETTRVNISPTSN